jgi:glycosyltransferase involved in cell wall biosynthesis
MPGTAVSVGILTHNRPGTLAQAIASVRAQAIIDYEIIVVSNGEGDDARRASHDIATAHGGRYFALPEANVSAARNLAIKSVKGEWIAVLDDHDLWLPTKLARQVETARRTGADLITTDYVQFYQDGTAVIRRARLLDGRSYPKANHSWLLVSCRRQPSCAKALFKNSAASLRANGLAKVWTCGAGYRGATKTTSWRRFWCATRTRCKENARAIFTICVCTSRYGLTPRAIFERGYSCVGGMWRHG